MKDKTYKCLNCNKKIREKAVTKILKDLQLCPQCYTKRNKQKIQLRVWHIPQVPMNAFRVKVKDIEEGKKLVNVLADYDLFQFKNHVKPDYSNASGLEIFEDGEWCEYYDKEGRDIWKIIREEREEK